MKKIVFYGATLIALFALTTNVEAKKKSYKESCYAVNIHCEACKSKIESKIPFEKGVKDLDVDLTHKTVTVSYDTAKTDSLTIQKALEKLDFVVTKPQTAKKR